MHYFNWENDMCELIIMLRMLFAKWIFRVKLYIWFWLEKKWRIGVNGFALLVIDFNIT